MSGKYANWEQSEHSSLDTKEQKQLMDMSYKCKEVFSLSDETSYSHV